MLKTVGNPSTRYGDQTIIDGNLVIGTAGKGIDFSADPSAAGMTSELLDDYEEGTWTPVVRGSSTAGTYELDNATVCRYTKIGRLVQVEAYIQLAAVITGGGTGSLRITGLPFSRAGVLPTGSVLMSGVNWAAGASLSASFQAATTVQISETNDDAGNTAVLISGVAATDVIIFTIVYSV